MGIPGQGGGLGLGGGLGPIIPMGLPMPVPVPVPVPVPGPIPTPVPVPIIPKAAPPVPAPVPVPIPVPSPVPMAPPMSPPMAPTPQSPPPMAPAPSQTPQPTGGPGDPDNCDPNAAQGNTGQNSGTGGPGSGTAQVDSSALSAATATTVEVSQKTTVDQIAVIPQMQAKLGAWTLTASGNVYKTTTVTTTKITEVCDQLNGNQGGGGAKTTTNSTSNSSISGTFEVGVGYEWDFDDDGGPDAYIKGTVTGHAARNNVDITGAALEFGWSF